MSLIRTTPVPLSALFRARGMEPLDRMWRQLQMMPETPLIEHDGGFIPSVEMVERDDEFLLTAELPGVKIENVDVDVEDGMLTLRGTKEDRFEKEEKRYHVWERSYGSFERRFTLPRGVDPSAVKADFEDGVLTVHLPKGAEAKGRKIEIKAAK